MNPAPAILDIQLFGQPQLREGDKPFAFRAPARALSLLVYLLLNRNESLAREDVAFRFWPDIPESAAREKLRDHLRRVRDALPASGSAPWILADMRTVRWNPKASIRLDVAEFERLADHSGAASDAVMLYTEISQARSTTTG